MNLKNKKKVFCAMSGGVDSSVAAALLKKKGYEVTGVYMKCYNLDGCGERDAEDARKAAEVLGIPFYIFDFEKEYKDEVVKYMVAGYKKGITPNPDVMCNKEIKFGFFLKKALAMGADYVATGHYVRSGITELPARTTVRSLQRRAPATSRSENPSASWRTEPIFSELRSFSTATRQFPRYSLLIAEDKNKDQSYFLWTLTQEQLKYCLFPIGDYLKSEVRKMAKKFGLSNADKKDSQGICFLGKVKIKDFLKKYISPKKGIVVNTKGEIVGEHDGAQFYTIGQRSGMGLGGGKKPRYIAEKNVKENAILVAEESDPTLHVKEVKLKNVNLINPIISLIRANGRMVVYARVRYRQPLVKARIFKLKAKNYKLIFETPQKFVASGQSAVFYLPAEAPQGGAKEGLGLEMLGGGIII